MLLQVLLDSFFSNLFATLNEWDTKLLLKINTVWTNSFLDSVYPWWREANAWVPLYLFLIVFGFQNFGKKFGTWFLFAVITLAISDQLSSNFIKNWVERPRPCNEPLLAGQVRLLLNHCSGGYSFTSSHATNHFAFAMFVFLTLGHVFDKWKWVFIIWAATICYGQVYVGVHYPLDVLCGGILGCGIGYFTGTMYHKRFGRLNLPVVQPST